MQINHEHWGRCLQLENERYILIITLDFGPRIIHFSLKGQKNVFYEDLSTKYEKDNGWKIRGGHRLWVAPEQYPRTYEVDNLPVSWKKEGMTCHLKSPLLNDLAKEIKISLLPTHVEITHQIKNEGEWPISCAPWALSVMNTDGKAIIPIPKYYDDCVPNRSLVLWPYSKMNDPRLTFFDDYFELIQDPAIEETFKIGLHQDTNWLAYFTPEQTFVKIYKIDVSASYPDFQSSAEVFCNQDFIELETLAPLFSLAPKQKVTHTERWEIHRLANEEKVVERMNQK